MVNPFLVPCLVTLRAEFDYEAPDRDRSEEGWIADKKHSQSSDHFPLANGKVRAIDVDASGPWPEGYSFPFYVGRIVERSRSGDEDRLEYVIWDRFIYERKTGYKKIAYNGKDPHTGHAHFSARHDGSGHDNTKEWGVNDMNAADKKEILAAIKVAGFAWDDVFGRTEKITAGKMHSEVWAGVRDLASSVADVDERLEKIETLLTQVAEEEAKENASDAPDAG